MLKNPAFYFNSDLCIGCKACMIACKDKHNHTESIAWRRVAEFSGGEWIKKDGAYEQNVFAYYISLACNHCENAVCVEGCPANAQQKDANGIVSIDPNRCVACHYCEWNCPYGAPQFDAVNKVMTKCDFCSDYLEQGKTPACIAACPCRALDYGEFEELKQKYGEHGTIAPLPKPERTKPHLIVEPNRHSKPQGSTMGIRGSRVSNPEEI